MASSDEELRWYRYFSSIDEQLWSTRNYCEIDRTNFSSFSNEYTKIIFAASTHFEFLAKSYCDKSRIALGKAPNMGEMREAISSHRPGVATCAISLEHSGLDIVPLEDWAAAAAAKWWKDYTSLKHDYGASFRAATQKSAIYSTAACFVMILYLFEQDLYALSPHPKLMSSPILPAYLTTHTRGTLP